MQNDTIPTLDPRLAGVRLCHGAGKLPPSGFSPDCKLCAMQVAAILAGVKPDAQGCVPDSFPGVSPVMRSLVIKLNDGWFQENRQKLLLIVPLLIDSEGSPEVEIKRSWFLLDWSIRTVLAWACDKADLAQEGSQLRALEAVTDRTSAELARRVVRSVCEKIPTLRDRDRDRARDRARALDLDLALALALALDRARARALDLDLALALDLDLALDLALALALALDRARARDLALESEFADLCIKAIRDALAIN